MAQVRHLKTEIDNTGTKVYAISVDGAEKASAMKRKTRFDYDILCDEKLEVINLYGLVDDEQLKWDYTDEKVQRVDEFRSISLSATILINRNGFIEYNWSGHYINRPPIDEAVKILKNMN